MNTGFPLQIKPPSAQGEPPRKGRKGGELDPPTRPWAIQGFLFGTIITAAAIPKQSPLHFLIPEQNAMTVAALVAWGMAGGFLFAKWRLLGQEQKASKSKNFDNLIIGSGSDVEGLIDSAERIPGLRGKRLADLLRIWRETGSSFQVERALDTDKELYEHTVQSSYLLARVLVWAIPIFGFVGTVGGISHAVGAFDKVLNSAENVEALREGLVEVTGGLSKAFHTTSLGLVLSVILQLPITYLEKKEQEILGSVDSDLRFKLLALIPPEDGFSEVEEASMSKLISDAFERHLPDPSVLVEPARLYAERLTDGTLERLDPIKSLAKESIEGISEARLSIQDQTENLKRQLDGLGENLTAALHSLSPVLTQMSRVSERAVSASVSLDEQQDFRELNRSVNELRHLLTQLGKSDLQEPDRSDPGKPLARLIARLSNYSSRRGESV